MARIFSYLALAAVTLLLVNIAVGFWTGPFGEAAAEMLVQGQTEHSPTASEGERTAAKIAHDAALSQVGALQSRVSMHILLGVVAALVVILVNSVSVTYFIGTSRWCREVVETYRMDAELANASLRLKSQSLPWAVAGILTMLGIVALGGVSYPINFFSDPSDPSQHLTWRLYHYLFALMGTGLVAYAFFRQQQNIAANFRAIDRIMDEVGRIRAERGLDGAGQGRAERDQGSGVKDQEEKKQVV